MQHPISVSGRWLLSLYLVVPLCLLVVALDFLVMDETLARQLLPDKPSDWAWWTIVFGTPHIVASFFSYADREYLTRYKTSFFSLACICAALAYGLPELLGWRFFMVFYALITMYHVLSQQFGIAVSLSRVRPGRSFLAWKITATLGTVLSYLWIFSPGSIRSGLSAVMDGEAVYLCVMSTSALLIMAASYFSWRFIRASQVPLGRWYILGNTIMLWTCWLMLLLDYSVFVILIPRFIHDTTAFMVYAVHDQNRFSSSSRNVLYRLTGIFSLPPLVVCPILAIALSYLLFNDSNAFVITVLNTLALLHYFNEASIWRKGTLHRENLAFS